MKNYSILIGISLLVGVFFSCNNGAPEDQLSEWKHEKDSLKEEYDKIATRLSELDVLITEADPDFHENLTLVTTEKLELEEFNHFFEIYGEVQSDKNVLIYPEYMGSITSVRVDEGEKVSAGQTIATIDNQIIRNQIKELETSYELANTVFEKQARLWEKNIGSELQYLEAKNNKESLETSLATLNSQLSKTIIKAPFSGVVDELFSNPGDMASTQMPFARIVNTKNIYIECEVSEQLLGAVKKGTDVEVNFPSLNETINAEVSEMGSFINPENRSFKVRVDLPAGGSKFKPNLLANLKIKDYSVDSTIVVEAALIQQTSDGADFLYIIDDKEDIPKSKRIYVELGREYQGQIEVLNGIESGDILIKDGARSIRNGQQVRIYKNQEANG